MPGSLRSFTEAAADAIAREIATLRREALNERAARDAEHALRLKEIDTLRGSLADTDRQLKERLASVKDGVSVTLEDVAPLISEVVAHEILALPAPKDGDPGRDADPAVIAEMIGQAVAALPPPQPGKDADPEVVAALVRYAVAAIPAAQDGKSVSLDDVAPLIVEEVAKAVEAIIPEPDVMPDELAANVAKAVRLMAETPAFSRASQPAFEQRVHVHLPNVIGSAIHVPESKAPDVHVTVEQPRRRKTETTVTEHDAKGRIKKFEQEEVS